nr:hypothetical protein [uncultured Psychroserpens sp.]
MASSTHHELTCKTCNSKVSINAGGEFNTSPFKNGDIKTALRELFILKNQFYRA